jgi:hypothetical protein
VKRILLAPIIFVMLLGLSGCPAPVTPPALSTYSGSGSNGDLLVFTINPANNTYTVYNETEDSNFSGSYTMLTDPDFNGIYQVTSGSDLFFAVELQNQVIAANFPTGTDNTISYGVSNKIDNTGKTSQLAGNYSWIRISNQPVNGSTGNKQWGFVTVGSDNTWYKKNLTSDLNHPDLETDPFPVTALNCSESGTWTVDPADTERMDITVLTPASMALTGFGLALEAGSVMLIDLGTGNGFLLGIKNPDTHIALSAIAGTYKYVDVWNPGVKGAGNYIVAADGSGTFAHKDQYGTVVTGTITQNLAPCPDIPNMFFGRISRPAGIGDPSFGDFCVYIGVTNDCIMHFIFDLTGYFAAYGTGVKL